MNNLTMMLPLILLIAVMWLLLIRPQRKREKEVQAMRSNLRVGDEIVTIGGICAKIVKIKEETIVIQVGSDKVKMEMMKWSISKVVTPAEAKATRKAAVIEDEEDVEEEAPKKAMPKRMKKAAKDVEEDVEEKAAEAEEAADEAVAEAEEAVDEAAAAAEETVAEAEDAAEDAVAEAEDAVEEAADTKA